METSIFVAQTLSLLYLSIGAGLLLNRNYYQSAFIELIENKGLMFLSGWMALMAGVALVNYHNVWSNDWRMIITVVGWIALAKGIILFAFPSAINAYKKLLLNTRFLDAITYLVIVLGMFFGYYGFFR